MHAGWMVRCGATCAASLPSGLARAGPWPTALCAMARLAPNSDIPSSHGGGRLWIEAKQVPVTIGNAFVQPGDLVLGDADGVVFVPRAREAEVLDAAARLDVADRRMTEALGQGMPLAEARRQYGAKRTLA